MSGMRGDFNVYGFNPIPLAGAQRLCGCLDHRSLDLHFSGRFEEYFEILIKGKHREIRE
jgi:hypothetical protein